MVKKVLYYDKQRKIKKDVYDSVLDVEIGDRDLHQCADAIMLLRVNTFYSIGKYEDIALTSYQDLKQNMQVDGRV